LYVKDTLTFRVYMYFGVFWNCRTFSYVISFIICFFRNTTCMLNNTELNMFIHLPYDDLYGDQLIIATMRQIHITYLINNFLSS